MSFKNFGSESGGLARLGQVCSESLSLNRSAEAAIEGSAAPSFAIYSPVTRKITVIVPKTR